MKEWIVCEDNCLKCSYGATLDCDGDCPRCPRNTYCPCVTFVSFAAGKLAPVVQPVTTTFERPRKRPGVPLHVARPHRTYGGVPLTSPLCPVRSRS